MKRITKIGIVGLFLLAMLGLAVATTVITDEKVITPAVEVVDVNGTQVTGASGGLQVLDYDDTSSGDNDGTTRVTQASLVVASGFIGGAIIVSAEIEGQPTQGPVFYVEIVGDTTQDILQHSMGLSSVGGTIKDSLTAVYMPSVNESANGFTINIESHPSGANSNAEVHKSWVIG